MELRTIGTSAQTAAKVTAEGGAASPSVSVNPSSQAPTQTVNAVSQAANIPNMEQVKQAAYSVADSLKSMVKGLEFEIEQDTDRVVIKIIDPETRDVIKQIPSEEVLKIAKSMDMMTGKLLKATA